MDLGGLRRLVRDLNFQAHGVPAYVSGVSTRIVWLTPATEILPVGNDAHRAEPRRVMAIRSDEVLSVPRGTIISVTEHGQDFPGAWRVDGIERIEPDHVRVVVVPA